MYKKVLTRIIYITCIYIIISTFLYYAISHKLNQNIWFNMVFYGISFVFLGNWKKINNTIEVLLNGIIVRLLVTLFFGFSFFLINIPENPMNFIAKVCSILGLAAAIQFNFINKNIEGMNGQ